MGDFPDRHSKMGPMRVITTTEDLADICAHFASHDFVTVDTEFMREQTFWPALCLIQAAVPDCEVIIDPLAEGIDLTSFYNLMGNKDVVKVFHAARQDIEIVVSEAGFVPSPVFDTQIAAMVCGFGESISYVNLVKKVTGTNLDKSSRFTDWSRRPLSNKQLEYAIGDVTHLRDIYLHLRQELDATQRASWLDEEMAVLTAPETYQSDPAKAWQRLKMRVKNRKALGILIELAAWRERLAQTQDVPRGRILRDDALYDIANQAPTTSEQLSQLRTLSEGFARSQRAREILEAVRTGLSRDVKTLPALNQNQPMSAEATATMELLKVLLKAAAAHNRVAPRLIADSSELERIATEEEPNVPALSGWRRKLFGEDALKLKRGELALTLSNGEVLAIPTKV